MDPRRLLILTAAGLSLAACATLPGLGLGPAASASTDPAKPAGAHSEPPAITSPPASATLPVGRWASG